MVQIHDQIRMVTLPSWIVLLQSILFAILYGIWAVPETILIRHICLIIGALLGVYVIVRKRRMFLTKQAIPVGLLLLVFVWAIFQMLFLETNRRLQLEEFLGIWKRTILGFIFAIGFGLALAEYYEDQVSEKRERQVRIIWGIIYFGLLLPTLIYLVKYILTFKAPNFGIFPPEYLKLHYMSLPFYMPKTTYVAFCLPLFAISLSQIIEEVRNQRWRPLYILLNVASCAAVLFIFFTDNIKNGTLYAFILTSVFCIVLLFKYRIQIRKKDVLITLVLLVVLSIFSYSHMKKNESWPTILADMRIATQLEKYDHWKYNGEKGYPSNEFGKTVSITYYERIAWGIVGAELLLENPLGYGLIERSFGHLAKEKWPESKLHQSHSGWLDLALGLGIPGIGLVLLALLFVLIRCIHSNGQTANFGFWILLSLVLLWCTTEVSQKVYFDCLIFLITWVGTLTSFTKSAQTSTSNT